MKSPSYFAFKPVFVVAHNLPEGVQIPTTGATIANPPSTVATTETTTETTTGNSTMHTSSTAQRLLKKAKIVQRETTGYLINIKPNVRTPKQTIKGTHNL